MSPLRFILTAFMIAAIGSAGCHHSPSEFEKQAAFAQNHRSDLAELISDIKKQTSLRRLIWSDGREFITVIYRDDRISEGYGSDTKWQPEIAKWIERLKAAGCHGFDDGGPQYVTSLYLDIDTYVAVPSDSKWLAEYAAWATKGKNPDGCRCLDLGQGWYLTTETN